MLKTIVRRSQHAVGHGGFHTGSINIREMPRTADTEPSERPLASFNYVYDCGSEQNTAFSGELASYRSVSSGRTDILFVSHLHSDHISGIDRLQAMAPATTVVVPYLDLCDRLILVLSDLGAGAVSSSALEYFGDPVGWWQRRGARQIVFLEPGSGDDEPPGRPVVPDGPVDGGEGRDEADTAPWREGKEPGARLASHLRKPRRPAPDGLEPADPRRRSVKDGAVLAGAGSAFHLEWRADVGANWQVGDWILLPYVHPVNEAIRNRFRAALKKKLKLRGNDEARLSKALTAHLTSFEKTRDLVDLYSMYFGKSHNALSMSLYSGPLSTHDRSLDDGLAWDRRWHGCYGDELWFGQYHDYGDSIGWLGTGDAALAQSKWREPWLNFFAPFATEIGVMTLPHHGSAHNFHEDILIFDRLKLALAPTVERRNRVARMRETLGVVEARGITTRVVDDEHRNAYSLFCRRIMG
ncbi:MBL fold metallo-hydrolase [Sinorhizobium meliloti]|uniref:MBL fold metallo-hydrolase n=1 Tax=Rhizobium meliloti TaxID=382 RepID=UPI0023801EFB|nr:MBL fold metallo-hydrolase [Sinorhizobium meliloti]MDE3799574.1 MBL fold metallo-hydrolase [Sinorhizobium meliloti]